MASLYRKYRPILFADIVGQEHIKQTLQNEIIREMPVHCIFFTGRVRLARQRQRAFLRERSIA